MHIDTVKYNSHTNIHTDSHFISTQIQLVGGRGEVFIIIYIFNYINVREVLTIELKELQMCYAVKKSGEFLVCSINTPASMESTSGTWHIMLRKFYLHIISIMPILHYKGVMKNSWVVILLGCVVPIICPLLHKGKVI